MRGVINTRHRCEWLLLGKKEKEFRATAKTQMSSNRPHFSKRTNEKKTTIALSLSSILIFPRFHLKSARRCFCMICYVPLFPYHSSI